MGCCGRGSTTPAAVYPHEAMMPDGTTVTVTSAADERNQRERARQRQRAAAQTRGYTAERR